MKIAMGKTDVGTESEFSKEIKKNSKIETKNIVISGTNFWNPGDDFVRDGIIGILKKLFSGFILNFHFYNFNQDYFPQSKFSGIHNMVSKGDLESYGNFIDYIVVAGLSAGDEIKDLYNWIIQNNLTDRVYLIGAGYENQYVDAHIRKEPELTIFKNAKVITGRTDKIPDLIKEYNWPYFHINCPAILSVNNTKEIPDGKKVKRIAFSIQLPHEIGILNQSCDKNMYELSLDILKRLDREYQVAIICHHKKEYFHFLNLMKDCRMDVPVIFSSYYQDLHNVYPLYDLVVTTRLHSSLFANGFGIPGIIINGTERHIHALTGFPHSYLVDSIDAFDAQFNIINHTDLKQIADEAKSFKNKLLNKYIEVLKKPFGIKPIDKPDPESLPVHFFTIVLNGEPFIRYHIDVLKSLDFKWHWHIIEGVADLKYDTAWSLQHGGRISGELHNSGLSNDGTSKYIDAIAAEYPQNITIYRKPDGIFWDGKLEMVNAPLRNIKKDCLLWEIDADELWTAKQIITARQLFIDTPEKTAAYYLCHYFVGKKLVITSKDTYGNHTDYEWIRTWQYKPGDQWTAHEPPQLCRNIGGQLQDLSQINPFLHDVTESNGLVFQHFAYIFQKQLRFKEIYYGYCDAVENWEWLNEQKQFPVKLKDFFDWVNDEAIVETIGTQKLVPVVDYSSFIESSPKKEIMIIRTDSIGDNILASSMLPYLDGNITMVCQNHITEIYNDNPHVDKVIGFDKNRLYTDCKYRQDFINMLQKEKPTLLINAVYSREIITDVLCQEVCKNSIAFEGDLCNITEQDKAKHTDQYTKLVETDKLSELDKYKDLLSALNIQVDSLEPQLHISGQDKEYADNLFEEYNFNPEKTIALFAGAQYGIKHYDKYGEVINNKGYTVIALGAKENYEINEKNNPDINLSGKTTIMQAAAIVEQCAIAVGADTGLAHVACAVNTPNVILLGGGHYGRFMPYSRFTEIVDNKMDCFGCNWVCEHDEPHCILDIKPYDLHVAVERVRLAIATYNNGQSLFDSNELVEYTEKAQKENKTKPYVVSVDKFYQMYSERLCGTNDTLENIEQIESVQTPNIESVPEPITNTMEVVDFASTIGKTMDEPTVKLSFVMIVLNGMPFIELALKAIYDYAYEIIIVEGAVKECIFAANPNGSSTDGTVEAIKNFPDPNGTIRLIQGQWPEKLNMQNEALGHVAGNYIWLVDSDEVYKGEDIKKMINILKEDPEITRVDFIPDNFWKGYEYVICSNKFTQDAGHYRRIFKNTGEKFTSHRPPTMPSDDKKVLSGNVTRRLGIHPYHYSYVNNEQVEQKIQLYTNYGWGEQWNCDLEKWYRKIYLKWTPENRIEIEKQWGPWTGDKESYTIPFAGKHPKVMEPYVMTDIICTAMGGGARSSPELQDKLKQPIEKGGGLVNVLKDINNYTVSAIISCCNSEKYLRGCLDNLYEQTIINQTEIIVVISGSEQNERDIVQEYQEKYYDEYDNLKLIITDERETVYQAWNRASKVAKGKYITNANTDDRRRRDAFELMAKALDEYPVGMVYADSFITNVENDNFEETQSLVRYDWPDFSIGTALCNFAFGPQAMWRADVHKEIGYFDESYEIAADYDFFLKVSINYGAKHLRETLGLFHQRSDSISGGDNKNKTIQETVRLLTKHCNETPIEKIYPIEPFDNFQCDKAYKDFTKTCDNGPYCIPFEYRLVPERSVYTFIHAARNVNGLQLDGNKNWIETAYHEVKFWDVYRGQNGIAISENEREDAKKCLPRKPKILFTMYGWNESGGGTMHPKGLALHYAKLGYDVAVFYAGGQISEKPYQLIVNNDNGVELYGAYNRPTVFTDTNTEREIRDDAMVKIFANVLDKFRPDIVHYHNIMGMSFAIVDETVKRFIPSIYTTHNYYMIDPELYLLKGVPENEQRKQAALKALNNIDLTLAVSQRVNDILVDYGADENKMAVLHQIPDTTKDMVWKAKESVHSPLRFGYLGSIIPWKGVHDIITASKDLNVEFHIYGKGQNQYADGLIKISSKNIIWHGEYSVIELPGIGKEIDCLIVPSVWEECAGLIIIEALAMGIPVIIANNGGMPEFIQDKINGRVYNNVDELRDIIEEIIVNPGIILEMSKHTGLPYNYEEYADHLLEIYRNLKKTYKIQK